MTGSDNYSFTGLEILLCCTFLLALLLIRLTLFRQLNQKRKKKKEELSPDQPVDNQIDEEYILPVYTDEVPAQKNDLSKESLNARHKFCETESNLSTVHKKHRLTPLSREATPLIWLSSAFAAFLIGGNGIDNLSHGFRTGWVEVVSAALLFLFFSYWCIISIHALRRK